MAKGRPSLLTEELISKAAEVAKAGGAIETVANACGIGWSTAKEWLALARSGEGTDLHNRFLAAIQEGQAEAEKRALLKITAFDDSRDAQWWLTHHPRTRDTWSDAAATRREVDRVLGMVAAGVASSGLTPEQKQAVLLSIRASGVGLEDAETP